MIVIMFFLINTALAQQPPPKKLWGTYCAKFEGKSCDFLDEFNTVVLKNSPFFRVWYEHCQIDNIQEVSPGAYKLRLACATNRPGPPRNEYWALQDRDILSDLGYILRRR